MIGILLTSFCIFGVCQIIVESSLFSPLRNYLTKHSTKNIIWLFMAKIFNCFLCFSVWMSAIIPFFLVNVGTIIDIKQLNIYFFTIDLTIFVNAMVYSSIVWLLRSFETYLTSPHA